MFGDVPVHSGCIQNHRPYSGMLTGRFGAYPAAGPYQCGRFGRVSEGLKTGGIMNE
jgi:hypothetical protein